MPLAAVKVGDDQIILVENGESPRLSMVAAGAPQLSAVINVLEVHAQVERLLGARIVLLDGVTGKLVAMLPE